MARPSVQRRARPGAEQRRRRLVRQTPTGPVLRIRTASNCVDIPLVNSFIYLGAAVSYDHFEDRTLAHRLEIGKKNFGRVTKILRGRNALTRTHKLRIWQACVYTATVYGLDACGITPIGAKKLTTELLRHIRLIVRDPVYITNRTHQAVLEQWGLLAPIEAIKYQMLQEQDVTQPDPYKRGPNSKAWHRVWGTLEEATHAHIVLILSRRGVGVPCPECGVYFESRTSMRSQMSRKHKHHAARPVNQVHRAFDKQRDALGGLLTCRHCRTKLCDFSSLGKHINERRCRVLFPVAHHNPSPSTSAGLHAEQPPPEANPTKGVLSARASAPLHFSGPLMTEPDADPMPYFARPAVRAVLARYAESAAFHLQDRRWLRHHCALCSQWVSDPGKMKQHYRLSHAPDHQRFLQPASRLCSKFNTPGSPCDHCGATTKAPRQHPAKCTVLWHVMSLKLTEAGVIGEDGTASGGLWPPSGCPSTRDDTAPPDWSKAARTDQGKGRPGSLAPRSRQRWSKGGSKGQGGLPPRTIFSRQWHRNYSTGIEYRAG